MKVSHMSGRSDDMGETPSSTTPLFLLWKSTMSQYTRTFWNISLSLSLSYPKSWHEWISEYIRIEKIIRTNIRINIQIKNIWIFEYLNIFVTLCYKQEQVVSKLLSGGRNSHESGQLGSPFISLLTQWATSTYSSHCPICPTCSIFTIWPPFGK